ncbi:MAG: hypothetical protein ACI9P7_000105 [Candidatus Azotimanducaceae bacterium]|jgi:hypothetical protein
MTSSFESEDEFLDAVMGMSSVLKLLKTSAEKRGDEPLDQSDPAVLLFLGLQSLEATLHGWTDTIQEEVFHTEQDTRTTENSLSLKGRLLR